MWKEKIIIDKRQHIDSRIIDQAQLYSPRDGYRLDFDNPFTTYQYMHFLKSQLIWVLVSENNELLSFAGFGQDNRFSPYYAQLLWNDSNKSCFFMYFFTPEYLRGKWYGKTLYEWIITYLQQNTAYVFMNFSTPTLNNIAIYKKRWARQILENLLDDEKQYYFTHELT